MESLLKRLIKWIYVRNDLPEYFGDTKTLVIGNRDELLGLIIALCILYIYWSVILVIRPVFGIPVGTFVDFIILAGHFGVPILSLKFIMDYIYKKAEKEIFEELEPVSEHIRKSILDKYGDIVEIRIKRKFSGG